MQYSMVGLHNDVGVIPARERRVRGRERESVIEIANHMTWRIDLPLFNEVHVQSAEEGGHDHMMHLNCESVSL